ncbi:cyclic nucleotide-binding protein [Vibrio breoganii]|uniref:polysaccharide lyase family 7 protein n=1 Tax=Vibrio breoganii TaxID=553239 RepID=UPI000C862189|nr:polysaccharide lyase family 7 protein [Vibrio breoganii]PMG04393.1 cyclic nucleotide-binding protein [Vibrio breoganii]
MSSKIGKNLLMCSMLSTLPFYANANELELTNPGFETGNWDGWQDTDPSSISGDTYQGSHSAKITGSSGLFSQSVAVTPQTSYTLSGYIKGSGAIFADIDGQRIEQSASNSDWSKVELTFDSASQTEIEVGGKYHSGEGRFDTFVLVQNGSSEGGNGGEEGEICTNESLSILSASDDGSHDGHAPNNTIDNNLADESRWSSLGIGKSITYDLGTSSTVGQIDVAWYKGNSRSSYFSVDVSSDQQNWQRVIANSTSSGNVAGFESYPFDEVNARYVRIVGEGNSSNNWNSILEVDLYGCGTDSGEEPETPPETGLDPNLPPSGNFDLLDWTLSIPVDNDGDGKADTIKENALSASYENSSFFYTSADGGMTFKAPVDGAKTSTNTSYTRSELREMLRRGDTSHDTKGVGKNNWVFSSAPSDDRSAAGGVDGVLSAQLKVDHVTTTGDSSQIGRVIVGQIHANDDEPVRLYYRKLPGNSKGSIYIAHEPNGGSDSWYEMIGSLSSSASNPSDGIALGEVFSYQIEVQGNSLIVTIMREGKANVRQTVDMSNSDYDVGGQYMYFKAGVYNQNNTGDSDDYVQATFYKVENSHTGYAH